MPANPRTDPVQTLLTLLKANWSSANTAGLSPAIYRGDSGAKDMRQPGGFIILYQQGPVARERDDALGNFKTHREPITIEVHAGSRDTLVPILNEVERIVNVFRNYPDAYWDWIEDLGETPQGNYANAAWSVIQVEFWANSIAIAT
jgi:hypothetical protein